MVAYSIPPTQSVGQSGIPKGYIPLAKGSRGSRAPPVSLLWYKPRIALHGGEVEGYPLHQAVDFAQVAAPDLAVGERGGAEETVEYEGGSGSFEIADGKLLWTGAADEDCTGCVFVKVTE